MTEATRERKWQEVAAEFKRLAELTTLDWTRAELLRTARFYEKLDDGFRGETPRPPYKDER